MHEYQAIIDIASDASDPDIAREVLQDLEVDYVLDGLRIAPNYIKPLIVSMIVELGDPVLCAQALSLCSPAGVERLLNTIIAADDPVVLVQVLYQASDTQQQTINSMIQSYIPDVDKRLMRDVMDMIEEDPDSWDQQSWHGRKTQCFAGIVEDMIFDEQSSTTLTAERARETLGLTYEYANLLFHTPRTIEALRGIVDALIGVDIK